MFNLQQENYWEFQVDEKYPSTENKILFKFLALDMNIRKQGKIEWLLLTPNPSPVFDHMPQLLTNEKTVFGGKNSPKAPPFWHCLNLKELKENLPHVEIKKFSIFRN